jgi:hypothetical protein
LPCCALVTAGELKTYLGTSKGAKELSQVANTLFNSVALGKETEQSTCRIRACANDADDADALAGSCSNIFTAIKTLQQSATYSSKQCSSFGFGPGVKPVKQMHHQPLILIKLVLVAPAVYPPAVPCN